jgi:uncharacterized protein YjdB
MKKIITLVIAAVMLLGLTSCQNNAGSEDDNNGKTTGTALSFTTLSLETVAYGSSGEGGESVVAANPGTVGLWYDAGDWTGSTVGVSNVASSADSLSFDYTVSGSSDYGIQLFDTVNANGTYLVTYTVKAGTSQNVKCNEYTYSLTAGTAQEVCALVTVSGATATAGGTVISIQIPVDSSTIASGSSFAISNAKYAAVSNSDFSISALTLSSTAETLAAEDSTTLTVESTYTLTDSDSYVYSVYLTPDSDDVTWTSSNESYATVSAGTVTAVAAGEATITAKVGNKTATCTVTVTSSSEKNYAKYFSTTSCENGESAMVSVPGYMGLWTETPAYITAATAAETEYSVIRSSASSSWYGTQFFYAAEAGSYAASFNVKSSVTGDITIAENVYTLTADTEQTVYIYKTLSAAGTLISIQLGKQSDSSVLGAGMFTLSNLSIVSCDADLVTAKGNLSSEITTARTLYNNATEGTDEGEYAVGSKETLLDAVETAQTSYDNTSATTSDTTSAYDTLVTAVTTFKAGKVASSVSNPVDITLQSGVGGAWFHITATWTDDTYAMTKNSLDITTNVPTLDTGDTYSSLLDGECSSGTGSYTWGLCFSSAGFVAATQHQFVIYLTSGGDTYKVTVLFEGKSASDNSEFTIDSTSWEKQ